MRLYGAITKVTPLEDGTIRVEGIASSESVDDQGEIITAAAMQAAIPDYMIYPALREMHQLQAAGTTLEVFVDAGGITRIAARVVDPVAIKKVQNQVYRGFSIGGRVTKRDSANSHIITGLILSEISLVDRPANPEAMLECWKAALTEAITEGKPNMPRLATIGEKPAGEKLAAMITEPVQIWRCGDVNHGHAVKDEARRCIEKRAAAGENGGTQWEPEALAKSDGEVVSQNAASNEDEKRDTPDPAEKSVPVEAVTEIEGKPAEPDAEKAAAEEDATDPAPAVDKEAENSDPVDTAPAQHPALSPTAAALAAAAEVAALARAALGTEAAPEVSAEAEAETVEPEATTEKAVESEEGNPDNPGNPQVPEQATEGEDPAATAEAAPAPVLPAYPLDTERHIRAAWHHIHQEGAAALGSAEEVEALKAQITEAWKEKIGDPGPSEEAAKATRSEIWGRVAIAKSLGNAFDLIEVIYYLEDLVDMLTWESMFEGDGSTMPATVQALVVQTCAALRQLVEEETAEITAGDDDMVAMAAKAGGIEALTAALAPFPSLAALATKASAKDNEQNQAYLNKAYECASQARAMDGCSKAAGERLGDACKCMEAAGASGMAAKSAIRGEIEVIGKAGGHQALMDVAHFCLAAMGTGCCDADKASNEQVTGQLQLAHDHLCAAGASCQSAAMKTASAEPQTGEDELAKVTSEQGKDVIEKALIEITPLVRDLVEQNAELRKQLAEISETVERIDNTPLPPMALARTAGITKAADNKSATAGSPALSGDPLVNALALLTPQEQTLAMIKASYAQPRTINLMNPAERVAMGLDPAA